MKSIFWKRKGESVPVMGLSKSSLVHLGVVE